MSRENIFFSKSVADEWNKLPDELVQCQTVSNFKKKP